MTKSDDKAIGALQAKCAAEIAKKEAELKALRDKMVILDEIAKEANQITLELKPLSYANAGLTEAVIDAVAKIAGMDGVTAPQVRNYLINHGFVPAGKNFSISVGTALKRLTGKKIQRLMINEKPHYRLL